MLATQPNPTNTHDAYADYAMDTPLAGEPVSCEFVRGQVGGMTISSSTQHMVTRGFSGVQVNSYTTTRTDFHVIRADNTEEPYFHCYKEIPLRNGQLVTNLHLRRGSRRVWAVMVNHSNGRYHYMRFPYRMCFELGALWQVRWWWMALFFLPFLMLGLLMGGDAAGGVIGAGIIVSPIVYCVCMIVQWVRAELMWKTFKPVMTQLIESTLGKSIRSN